MITFTNPVLYLTYYERATNIYEPEKATIIKSLELPQLGQIEENIDELMLNFGKSLLPDSKWKMTDIWQYDFELSDGSYYRLFLDF